MAWLGLTWLGLAWLGLAWLGLAWLGSLGLEWLGLACLACPPPPPVILLLALSACIPPAFRLFRGGSKREWQKTVNQELGHQVSGVLRALHQLSH